MTPGLPARRVVTGALIALATLYLPPLIPLLGAGPLRECDHCVRTYCTWYPLVPTAVVATFVGPGEGELVAVASVIALVWLVGVFVAVRRAGRVFAALVVGVSAILSGAAALWFGALVRM